MNEHPTPTTSGESALTDPSLFAPASAPVAPRHLVRRITTWLLVVLFAIVAPLSLTSIWAVRTVTDTNRWVDTLQPLAEDPVITNYVADKGTQLLFEQLDVQKQIADLLPKVAAPLAAPLTKQLQGYTDTEMRKLVGSQWFRDFWKKENTFTHSTAVDILTGKTPPEPSNARRLVIALTPALVQAIDNLNARGVTVFNPIRDKLVTDKNLTLQLFSNKQLKAVQGYLNLAIRLKTLIWILTIALGVGAVLTSMDRRRGTMRVLGAGIISSLVILAALTVGRSIFISSADPGSQQFAQHIWDILLRYLRRLLVWSLLIFAAADLVLWVTGPSTWAVAVRRAASKGSKVVAEKTNDAYHSERTANAVARAGDLAERGEAFTRTNLIPLRWVGVVVAGVFVFFTSTTAGLWWLVTLLALYEVGISIPSWRAASKERQTPSVVEHTEEVEDSKR